MQFWALSYADDVKVPENNKASNTARKLELFKDRLAALGLSDLEKKLRGELLGLCSSLRQKAEGEAVSAPGNQGHHVWEWHSRTRGGSGWMLVKMRESCPDVERPSGRGG